MRDFADCLARRCVRVEPKGLEGVKKRWRKEKRAGAVEFCDVSIFV